MLKVQAEKTQISEYQRLLTTEWKKEFPDEVLALLRSCISAKDIPDEDPLRKLLDPGADGLFPSEYFRSLLQRVGDAAKFILLKDMPPLPLDYHAPKRLAKSAWHAARLATYLTLQAHTRLSGDLLFFRDVQALAFQAAIHFVLPAVHEKHLAEHAVLLHALALFPLEYYASDPEHFCYLLSMIHDYLGNVDQRLTLLHASFRLTQPEDHSFLTKAQEFWSELLDHQRYEEAEKFLFSHASTADPSLPLPWGQCPWQPRPRREMALENP